MPTLNNIGDFVIFKTNEPYLYVKQIRNYFVKITGSEAKLEIRWSTDNKTYSAWIDLTLDNIRNIVLDPDEKLWIEFRATLINGGPVTIEEFKLDFEFISYDKFKEYKPPIMSCSESGNLLSVSSIDETCFNPYNVNPAVCLYNELSYMVNNLFGVETQYFRAVPDIESQDIVFREYTLYNVESPKTVKVLVEGNTFPDSQLSYNPFGIEFEQPFEIHIDKRYFEEIFGVGTAPQSKDIIYFPINDRIYEVVSSYLFKAFMEKDSYWKVSLKKYQPKSNRYESEEVRNVLDVITTDASELFEEEMRKEEEKLTKPQQYNHFIGDRDYDPIREYLHNDIQIIEKQIKNYSIVIAEYFYNFNNLVKYNKPTQDIAVQYRQSVQFGIKEERSYSAWISETNSVFFNSVDNIELMALDTTNNILTIQISSNRNYIIGDYLKIFRLGGITFFGEIVRVNSPNSFDLKIKNKIIEYLDNYNSYWSGLGNYKCEKTIPNNLLNGYDEVNRSGIKFELFVNRYIIITLNEKEYLFALNSDLKRNEWYGIFINISNKFRQLSVSIWKRKWEENNLNSPQTTDLLNIYNKTINNIIPENRIADMKYNLLASNLKITNIRLFNQTAEIEKQSLILNQNIVKDSQNAIIIDNALPRLKLPFIGQTK